MKKKFLFFSKTSQNKIVYRNSKNRLVSQDLECYKTKYQIDHVHRYFKSICDIVNNNKSNQDILRNYHWFFEYRKVFEDHCIYFFKYKKLFELLEKKEKEYFIIISDKRLKSLIDHYCFYNKINVIIYYSFYHKLNMFFSSFLKLILSLFSLPFIILQNKTTIIYTSNNFSKHGNYDFRFKTLIPKLNSSSIKYFFGIRTKNNFNQIFKNFFLRFQPVMFFDSFDEISRILYPNKRDLNFSSFKEYLASAENFRSFKSLNYNHKILKNLVKMMKIKSAFIADNCERSNNLLYVLNQLNIPTIGIMKGVECKYYNVQIFLQYLNSEMSLLSQRHYGVWSKKIKNYLSHYSKVYNYDQIEISGPYREIPNSKSDYNDNEIKNICWFIEIHVEIEEILPFLNELLEKTNFKITFKTDPTKFEISKNYLDSLINRLSNYRSRIKISNKSIDKIINKYDLFIGAFTTALIDVAAYKQKILIIYTKQWQDYFDVEDAKINQSILVKKPVNLPTKILNLNIDSQKEFRNFYIEDNFDGSDWIVNKLKTYD
jgi:hypothetical protein